METNIIVYDYNNIFSCIIKNYGITRLSDEATQIPSGHTRVSYDVWKLWVKYSLVVACHPKYVALVKHAPAYLYHCIYRLELDCSSRLFLMSTNLLNVSICFFCFFFLMSTKLLNVSIHLFCFFLRSKNLLNVSLFWIRRFILYGVTHLRWWPWHFQFCCFIFSHLC